MTDLHQWEEELLRYIHNEKVRKRITEFHKDGKLVDENNREIISGEAVNYNVKVI